MIRAAAVARYADWSHPERRARLFCAALPLGTALGYVIGGLVGEAHGWRAALFAAGLAIMVLALREPTRGVRHEVRGLRLSLPALADRQSYLVNTAAQVVYTFAVGGLATWMPLYVARERGVPTDIAATTFGLLLVAAGLVGTLTGDRVARAVARRWHGGDFTVSGWSLVASLAFTPVALLAAAPVVVWTAMFATLLLLFINIGRLNAAMADVLPAELRATGFLVATMSIHLLGDAVSPFLIGAASQRMGLQLPVLVTGCLLPVAGLLLLWGRATLARDLARAGALARC
ncbi:MAG TPA: MFS transporter [Methylomirabilota bacterium]|jgi:hypothetical protein